MPSERLRYPIGARDEHRRIAWAPRPGLDRNVAAGNRFRRVNHFLYGVAVSAAEVEDFRADIPARERVESQPGASRQIRHVHVIADAGAVARRVVVAKHGYGRTRVLRRPEDERNEMRLRIMTLTPPLRCARRIEVAQ